MKRKEEFSTVDVCELSNLTYRQLSHWSASGILIPSIKRPMGSGSQSVYSADDVYIARLLSEIISLTGPVRSLLLYEIVTSAREMVEVVDELPETVYVTFGRKASVTNVRPEGFAHLVIHPSTIIKESDNDNERE